ncbi:MAG: glutathione binding-like protein [Pseudomonadota bacterium]
MIELYTWPTPNGHKIHIMLEEVGLPYEVRPVDINLGDQFQPEFLKISPNNRIPAIVDPDGPNGTPVSIFESGAILIYLAEKTGQLWPEAPRDRYRTLEWLMWQKGNVGPMFGQANHFTRYAPDEIPYAKERYGNERRRLYGVLERRLGECPFLAGDHYTIADIAAFPWTRNHANHDVELEAHPNFKRWHDEILARPAVARGIKVLSDLPPRKLDEKARDILFGATQYARR